MTDHNILVKALLKKINAALASPRQWRKGPNIDKGRACLHNTVCTVAGASNAKISVINSAFSRIDDAKAKTFPVFTSIASFNDHSKTTFKDVKKVLRKAIASFK